MHESLSGAAPGSHPAPGALRPQAPPTASPRPPGPPPEQEPPEQAPPKQRPRAPQSGARLKALTVIGAGVLVLLAGYIAVHPLSADKKPPPGDPLAGHIATAQLEGQTAASFTVSSGAEEVTVHGADLSGELYRVSTPAGSSVTPVLTTTSGSDVVLQLRGTKVAGQANVHVYLNKTVLWKVHLSGGGLSQVVDFPSGKLASVDVDAGAQQVDVSLPPPTGTLRVGLKGGSGLFAVHLATGPPVQVVNKGGTGALSVDGTVATGPLVSGSGWDTAADRYQIESDGPVAKLTVDRHP